jgi:methenyltetrahydrofolate cyclohydrolase
MLASKTVTELLDAFSAPTPTPGGGSAAALSGAVAASLLVMVAAMPKTRNGSPEDRSALDGALAKLQVLRTRLRSLIDEDAASYDGVVAAYKLPKGTDEEKSARKLAVQAAMRHATDIPIETFRAAAALFPLALTVGEHGNPNAKSDAGVGAQLAWAAMTGAYANVEINLDGTGDLKFATETRAALKSELASASEILTAVYAAIGWQNHLPPRS